MNLYTDILTQAHTLIAGQTGSGKSVLLNAIITTALEDEKNYFIFCDPKRVELSQYEKIDNCICYAESAEEIATALGLAIDRMEARYAVMKQKGVKTFEGSHIFVFIDELADLLISEQARTIKKQLQKLTALGRAAKVHVIAATQCPARKVLPAEITLNFSARIALHCQTQTESRQVINEKGAELLPPFGSCLYLRPAHGVERFAVEMMTESEIQEAITQATTQATTQAKQISKVKKAFRIFDYFRKAS